MKKIEKAELRNYIALIIFICITIALIALSIFLNFLIPYRFLGFFVMCSVTVGGLIVTKKLLNKLFKIREE